MATPLTDGGTFTPHPEGQAQAVCVDVVEQHQVQTQYGPKNKVRLVFQTDELMESGKPFLCSATFTASLNEKSRLRPFLEAWRGKRFTAEELKGFDPDVLIGANAIVQILHVTKNDKTYDNINAIIKLPKGTPPLVAKDYVRVVDRPKTGGNGHGGTRAAVPPAEREFDDEPDDDDLPF